MRLTPPEVVQAMLEGKRVEIRGFIASQHDYWKPLNEHEIHIGVLTNGLFVFRLAQEQEMITVGDVSFPKPESKPLEVGTEYWIAELCYGYRVTANLILWEDDAQDRIYLKRGCVHLSRENAIAHSKALVKLSGGNVDE